MNKLKNQFDFDSLVGESDANLRLDQWLKKQLVEYSRAQIQRWIECGAVLYDGKKVSSAMPVKLGSHITLKIPIEEFNLIPENGNLDIIYEDPEILVLNKPAGLLTHPAPGQHKGTILNFVAGYLKTQAESLPLGKVKRGKNAINSNLYSNINTNILRPGVVHRLDRDTTGLLIVAKTTLALGRISTQFEKREIQKTYKALVCGNLVANEGEITGAIDKEPGTGRMTVLDSGRFAITQFKVTQRYALKPIFINSEINMNPEKGSAEKYAIDKCRTVTALELYPKTGRTHQIRVHCTKIGHPVLGDVLYGGDCPFVKRQMLHAASLQFRHPRTNKLLKLQAPLPKDFILALKHFKKLI